MKGSRKEATRKDEMDAMTRKPDECSRPARAHAIFQVDAEEPANALDTVDSLGRRFRHRRLASTLLSSTPRFRDTIDRSNIAKRSRLGRRDAYEKKTVVLAREDGRREKAAIL